MEARMLRRAAYGLATLWMLGSTADAQTAVTGNLLTRVDSVSATIPISPGTDEYVQPTTGELNTWGTIIGNLCDGNYALAASNAGTIEYQLLQYMDNSSSPAKTIYVLEKQATGSNYWGSFYYDPSPKRARLFIQSPHSRSDANTEKQGAKIFRTAEARAFFFAGAHRCNSSLDAPCGGTNASCGNNKTSDQAHNVIAPLQRATEVLISRFPGIIAVQNHGFTKDTAPGSPDVEMSNGTTSAPTGPDYLLAVRDSLSVIDTTLIFEVSYLDAGMQYTATNNVQGRLINGSSNPCSQSAFSANGRFLHIEQALPNLRDIDANRQKLADAVARAIQADKLTLTAPNGGETWISGSSQSIVWSSVGTVDSVRIEYSSNNGSTWTTIASRTPNDGSYAWTVPGIGSSAMRVRILDVYNAVVGDTSAGVFKIDASVWPTNGTTTPAPIASTFGPRSLNGVYDYHRGLDLPDVLNTPIRPVKAGVVVRIEDTTQTIGTARERYGNWILVRHDSVGGQPRHTSYFHLNAFGRFHVGDAVSTTDTIAFMGKSGVGINTIHLHLQYLKNLSGTAMDNDKTYNPLEILPYADNNSYFMSFIDSGDSAAVKVEVPDSELDFDGVTLYGSLAARTIRFSTRAGINPTDNDVALYNGVLVNPDQFTIDSSFQRMKFWMKDAVLGTLDSAVLYDVKGYSRTVRNSVGPRYAVASGNWSTDIWAATAGGAAGSASLPTAGNDVVVNTGTTVTVNTAAAECKSVSFGSGTGKLAMASNAVLNVYGDFALFDTTHSAFSSWAAGAKLRFCGSAKQKLSGWALTNTPTNTTLMEVQVNKSGDSLLTPGRDMKLCLGTSLEVQNGIFVLNSIDDINGKIFGGSTATRPTIIVSSGAEFVTMGKEQQIRAGTSGTNPIGKVTVRGRMSLSTVSNLGMAFDTVEVESGGVLTIQRCSPSFQNVKFGKVIVKSGGTFQNSDSVNFWNAASTVILQPGGTYAVIEQPTVFPPTFTNNGLVRYAHATGDGNQTITDMDYSSLAISATGRKVWTLAAGRTIADTLIVSADSLILGGSSPQTVTVGKSLRINGSVVTNNATLILGTSTSSTGTLSYTSGGIYGTFRRWFGASTSAANQFPLRSGAYDKTASVSFTIAPTTGGTLTGTYVATDPGAGGIPASDGATQITSVSRDGYWSLVAGDGLAGGTYTLDMTADGIAGVQDFAALRLLKRSTGGNWTLIGSHVAGTGSNVKPIIHRSGLSGFSEFGVGGTDNNPLPVSVASFEASALRSSVVLTWRTVSETNCALFAIERRPVTEPGDGENLIAWSERGSVQGGGTTNSPRLYRFEDPDVWPGRYAYRIRQVDSNSGFRYVGQTEVSVGTVPRVLHLEPNFPNPFNPFTHIQFTVAAEATARVRVTNALGQDVRVIWDEIAQPGRYYDVVFDGTGLSTGVYFVWLEQLGQREVRKLSLVK